MTTELLVQKSQLATTRVRQVPDVALQPGQVRVRVDRFALTANNITYAAFGDAMHYWDFYPVQGEGEGWGIVPVWGFGTVVESACAEVPVGERVYGYWPMASHAVLTPTRVTPGGWADGAAHRAPLPAVYNQYERTGADPFYRADTEDLQALLRPLFATSWLIDDFMADNDFFGARTLLLAPAAGAFSLAEGFDAIDTGEATPHPAGVAVAPALPGAALPASTIVSSSWSAPVSGGDADWLRAAGRQVRNETKE